MSVCKETPSETLIIGDLSSKIIDQLASLVDEVLSAWQKHFTNTLYYATLI